MLSNFYKEKYILISVVGPHAGETEKEIFERKIKEVEKTGRSYWLHKSYKAKPEIVSLLGQLACKNGATPLCLFIEASSSNGAQETKIAEAAKEFSVDKVKWETMSENIKVTGSINGSYALILDRLQFIKENRTIDLWDYSSFEHPDQAVKIVQGGSTVCVVKNSSHHDKNKMKSHVRRILAVGSLVSPFEVWLR